MLGPGGLARVDPQTVRGYRNTSDTEEAIYVCVGGAGGYVGRDGLLPEGETRRERARCVAQQVADLHQQHDVLGGASDSGSSPRLSRASSGVHRPDDEEEDDRRDDQERDQQR